MKRAHVAAALVSLGLALGCQLIAGLEERELGDASVSADDAASEAGQDVTVPDTSTCERCGGSACVDLAHDVNNCGYCGRVCSSCNNQQCPATPMATFTTATALAIDANNLYVGTVQNLFAVRKSDNKKTTISTFGANNIAVAGGRVYFTETWSLWDVAITGGNTEHLIYKMDSRDASAPITDQLAVDPPNVFWNTAQFFSSDHPGIYGVAYDGGGLIPIVPDDAGEVPESLAVDSNNVYYTDLPSSGGQLRKVSRNGGVITTVSGSLYPAYALALTSKKSVLWSTTSDLHESALDGGNFPPIIINNAVMNIVVNGTRAYLLVLIIANDGGISGEIDTVDLDTRVRTVIATNLNTPALTFRPLLAVDDQFIYWLEGAQAVGLATLMKTPR